MMEEIFDILRLIIGGIFLAYASYKDVKTRRVKNKVWIVLGVIGIIILESQLIYEKWDIIYHFTLIPIFFLFSTAFIEPTKKSNFKEGEINNLLYYLLCLISIIIVVFQIYKLDTYGEYLKLLVIPSIILISYAFYYSHLLFGGADAKAMMTVALLVPFNPEIWKFPFWDVIINETEINFPAPYVILTNSVIIFIVIPLGFFIYNLLKRDIESPFVHCFLGYKMDIKKAKEKFIWPMEKVENNEVVLILLPKKKMDINAEIEKLEKHGLKRIWITPKTPFMVALFFGYIACFIFGDLMLNFMNPIFM